MRHQKKRQKLTKNFSQRKALLRSLITAIILKEKIITTEGKAKKVRPSLEKIISRSKKDTLATRRILLKDFSSVAVNKLMKEIGPRYKDRAGGYCRITKIAFRKNDTAPMALIELVK